MNSFLFYIQFTQRFAFEVIVKVYFDFDYNHDFIFTSYSK